MSKGQSLTCLNRYFPSRLMGPESGHPSCHHHSNHPTNSSYLPLNYLKHTQRGTQITFLESIAPFTIRISDLESKEQGLLLTALSSSGTIQCSDVMRPKTKLGGKDWEENPVRFTKICPLHMDYCNLKQSKAI